MNIQFLLFYRWLCVNLFGAALMSIAYMNGWIQMAINADPTGIVMIISLIFLWGLLICGYKIWNINQDLNHIKNGDPSKCVDWREYNLLKKERKESTRGSLIEALKIKLFSDIAFVKYLANSLVVIGLIGTVVGFIIALSGVDPSIVSDVNAIGPMVSTLITGMSVALYTTLVGSVFNLWLSINYHFLAKGMVALVASILESKSSDL